MSPASSTRAGRRASVDEHQREQPDALALVRHQRHQHAAEPDALGGEVDPRAELADGA